MNKDYTHVAMIIDRSGSMSTCWNDVSKGYEQIIKDNKAEPGKCTFTVAAFDDKYDLLEDFTDIKDVKETLSVSPRGYTALLDAVGKTIVTVGEQLNKLPESDRPAKVMVIIQTDGEENASREYNKEQIKDLITEQTEKYAWQFQFIGASLDAVNESHSWGINAKNTSVYDTNNSAATFAMLGTKMRSARSIDDMALYSASMAFTESEKEVMNNSKS